jgi:hypothetical protein
MILLMNTLRIRFWLFILGCIGSRSVFTLLAYHASCNWLRLLGGFALIPVIGWFYIIFIGRRDTGMEVFGSQIWWKNLRPAHMLLWGFFSYLALVKCHPFAWVPLAVDTVFGLSSFLIYHGTKGHLPTMLGM